MNVTKSCALLALSVSGTACEAASGTPWFVHIGAARLDTDEVAKVSVVGTPVPGASVHLSPRYTAAIELGYSLTPDFAVAVSAGLPLKQTISAAGTIQALGRLGRITYGPAAVTVQWHPLRTAVVRPYVGAGVSYMHVFANKGAAVQDFHVPDDVGPVVQGGFDVPLGSRFGVFVDVKKGWLRTTATGSLAGAPVSARIRLDPLIFHTGVAIRF